MPKPNRNRICIWKRHDYELHCAGLIPDCTEHEHVSRYTALTIASTLLYSKPLGEGKDEYVYEARWLNANSSCTVIIMNEAFRWGIKKSAGFDVHQLIHA